MSLRSAVRGVARLAGVAGGIGLVAVAVARQPDADKPPPKPVASYIPPADAQPTAAVPLAPVVSTEPAAAPPVNGNAALPKALADGRAAYGKVRDYACYLVRQEKVHGKFLAEQTAELRVRTQPFSVDVRVVGPKALAGQETIYQTKRSDMKVRFRAAGVEGLRGFATLPLDDSKVTADTRHPITEVGLLAVIDRVEKAVATEKRLNHPVQVLVSDYAFADRPVARYEVFTDLPHPGRYAFRSVLYVDKETRLPVRFEAYEQPKAGGPAEGELMEVQSFLGLKLNTNLGEAAFDR